MIQENVLIGDVNVPVLIKDNERYYPISYLTKKVLLRTQKSSFINRDHKDKYVTLTIDFGENNIQECRCISEEMLKMMLPRTQAKRLSLEQKKSQNSLHKYLNIELIPEYENRLNKLNKDLLSVHDEYTKDIIKHEIKVHNMCFQLCPKCNKYYPETNTFFRTDERREFGYTSICKVCEGKVKYFKHYDKDTFSLKQAHDDLYHAMKVNNLIKIYQAYLEGKIKNLPDCYCNKNDLLKIIEWLYKINKINIHNLTIDELVKQYKLKQLSKYISIHEIYTHLFGEDYYFYCWKYPKFQFREIKLTYEIANKVFSNYLKENNIPDSDLLELNYEKIAKESGLVKISGKDSLYFAVQYNDFKYAGYLFKTRGNNYYKTDKNILFDLKYLIEQDMKLDTDKIPLYLTKHTLQKRCGSLYNYIVTKKNGSIYEWVNKLYPNKFTETDFEINAYRDEFDSDTECFIHEILKDKFNNVIYNQKHTNRTITLDSMIPDWFIMTDNGVWIVEYFGMYTPKKCYNTRVKDYIEKTHRKIDRYKNIKGYKFIFLYPSDIADDFKGVKDKLCEIE